MFLFLGYLCSSQGTILIFQRKGKLCLLSCNIRGLWEYDKRRRVIDHFLYSQNNDLKPDIFTFQETHSMADVQKSWASKFRRGYKVFMSHGTNVSKGVLLGFAPHLNVNVQSLKIDTEGRYIVANVNISGESFTVIAMYLPPNQMVIQKLETLNSLMSVIAQSQNTRVIWCGDFNMVLDKQ